MLEETGRLYPDEAPAHHHHEGGQTETRAEGKLRLAAKHELRDAVGEPDEDAKEADEE